jgi:hypothetical protein
MSRFTLILAALVLPAAALRADLVLEQKLSDTNGTHTAIVKVHGDKMRLDQDTGLSIIADLKTRDSYTLLNVEKKYLFKFGSEVRFEMEEERKHTHGTNEVDAPPALPVDTGKSEMVEGFPAEIYSWSGAAGLTQTLWVATNFPNADAIRAELAKVDRFNDSGPHRNRQPEVGRLPGMVVKTVSTFKGHVLTNTLVSVKLEPVDAALFEIPPGYVQWKKPAANKQ